MLRMILVALQFQVATEPVIVSVVTRAHPQSKVIIVCACIVTYKHRVAGTSQTHVETNPINFRGTETSMLLNEPKQSLVSPTHT